MKTRTTSLAAVLAILILLGLAAWYVSASFSRMPASAVPPAHPAGPIMSTSTVSVATTTGPSGPAASSVTVSSVSPTYGAVGSGMTVVGSGFDSSNTVLFDGLVAVRNVRPAVTADGQERLTITVPSSLAPDCKAGQACPMFVRVVTAATYRVSVETAEGTSNNMPYVVTSPAAVQP